MNQASQLTFDLGLRPALDREEFLVAPSNEVAVALIDRWPDWPVPVAVLWGPAGAGKSHLAEVWRRASGALSLSLAGLGDEALVRLGEGRAAVLLEDVDRVLAREAGQAVPLLHLYNLLQEGGRHLLMTGRAPPQDWPVTLPDLSSRLAAALAVELGPPDEALIGGIMVKLFADRQLRLNAEVLRYLLPRMERSFAAAHELVTAIDQMALAGHREITVALAREALAKVAGSGGATDPGAEGSDHDIGEAGNGR